MTGQVSDMYYDENGVLRDSQLEHIFDEFFEDKPTDEITAHNLGVYARQFYPQSLPVPDLTDYEAVAVWATSMSYITIWKITDESRQTITGPLPADHVYAAKMGTLSFGLYTTGKTPRLALLAAVAQLFREFVANPEVSGTVRDPSQPLH